MPSIVILDPRLTLDLSPRLTAATGMDALAHNLEAFCAPGFHPMADGIAIEGMRLIKKSLLKAVKNGSDLDARSDLLAAASMGSTAFQKGLGAIHSLSHPLNAQFNLHHGLSNAIFMPYVLTFNKENIEERIISICDYLNLSKSFDAFLEWILELRKELNIPHKLSDAIEINKMNLDDLAKMALDDPSTSSTFVLKVSTVTESHSTMVTCSAPRKAAPIPRTPFPAPKSRTCFPSNPSPSPILVNHAAARLPSVGYCSSSTE